MLIPTSRPGSSVSNKTGTWRSSRPVVDSTKCGACGLCARNCPEPCIEIREITEDHKKTKPIAKHAVIDYDFCKGCGLCAVTCPRKAIKMIPGEK